MYWYSNLKYIGKDKPVLKCHLGEKGKVVFLR
jgi:hypothetical protein